MTINAFDAAISQPWAIQPDWLPTIFEIAKGGGDIEEARRLREASAVAVRIGERLDGTRSVQMRDGVAVIPVTGPIFRYANLMTALSGATSTGLLAKDFNTALESRSVRAIVLDFDTPGGIATGINEFAQQIFDARGRKRIIAYGGGMVASAGIWLASAANEIVIDATAQVGSIGVVMGYRDTRQRDEKAGVREIEIVSSVSPNKRLDPDSESGRQQLQARVDAMADVFVAAVARNRGVSADVVIHDFGHGGMLVGAAAVTAGLADRLGSLESVIAELSGSTHKRGTIMSTQTKPIIVRTTAEMRAALENGIDPGQVEVLAAEVDTDAIRAESGEQAKTEERKRVLAILDLQGEAGGILPEVRTAIENGDTPGDTAMALIMAERDRGVSLSAMIADATQAHHATAPKTEEEQQAAAAQSRKSRLADRIAAGSRH